MPILQTIALEKRFGGILAAQNVNLAVESGARHALIGPNGAGKTTVINLLTGVLRPTGGRIELEGRDITGLLPHQRVRLGMARTFQRLELFTLLSVRENIRVAVDIRKTGGSNPAEFVDGIIQRVGLAEVESIRALLHEKHLHN